MLTTSSTTSLISTTAETLKVSTQSITLKNTENSDEHYEDFYTVLESTSENIVTELESSKTSAINEFEKSKLALTSLYATISDKYFSLLSTSVKANEMPETLYSVTGTFSTGYFPTGVL